MSEKEIISLIACLFSLSLSATYLVAVIKKKTKPHIFSWFIWGTENIIASVAQFSAHAGVGAIPVFLSGAGCLAIAIIGLKNGERSIAKSDWFFFIAALLAIPAWLLTNDPLGAVVLLTVICALGYYPTMRKAYQKPFEENLFVFAASILSCGLALLSAETYSVTTVLYLAAIIVLNSCTSALLIVRRRILGHISKS